MLSRKMILVKDFCVEKPQKMKSEDIGHQECKQKSQSSEIICLVVNESEKHGTLCMYICQKNHFGEMWFVISLFGTCNSMLVSCIWIVVNTVLLNTLTYGCTYSLSRKLIVEDKSFHSISIKYIWIFVLAVCSKWYSVLRWTHRTYHANACTQNHNTLAR